MANRADERKFHYIYKITRTDESGKYYIGMHSTDDLEDGYFGSGQLLWKSIKKHGKEKHSKEILEQLDSRTALKLREKEIVNTECVADPLCMNLRLGGDGGVFVSKKHQLKANKTINANKTPESRSRAAVKAAKTRLANGNSFSTFSGKTHTIATKQIMSEKAKLKTGASNSQYGTRWVFDGNKAIKIKNNDLQQYLNSGYWAGRKMLIGSAVSERSRVQSPCEKETMKLTELFDTDGIPS